MFACTLVHHRPRCECDPAACLGLDWRQHGAEVDFLIAPLPTAGNAAGVEGFEAWQQSRAQSGFPERIPGDVLRVYTTRPTQHLCPPPIAAGFGETPLTTTFFGSEEGRSSADRLSSPCDGSAVNGAGSLRPTPFRGNHCGHDRCRCCREPAPGSALPATAAWGGRPEPSPPNRSHGYKPNCSISYISNCSSCYNFATGALASGGRKPYNRLA